MSTEIRKLYNINKLFKAIPVKDRDVLLYLDWMDEDTYVGKGKIIEILESKPIIFVDNPLVKDSSIYFLPKRCLCEIKKSDKYLKGEKKQFIIPFRVPVKTGKEILLSEEKRFNNSSNVFHNNAITTVMDHNNSLVDSIEEVEYSREILKIHKNRVITSEEVTEIKGKLLVHQKIRQSNINRMFDKLYPEKAKRLKRLKKREKD
jgi:phosphopantetheine adenylyltransferase